MVTGFGTWSDLGLSADHRILEQSYSSSLACLFIATSSVLLIYHYFLIINYS